MCFSECSSTLNSSDLDTTRDQRNDVDVRTPARNVLQSVEYCLQQNMLGVGPVVAVAPVIMVLETLDYRDDFHTECQWARCILENISSNQVRIVSHVKRT